jgi:hypothetical protein
MTRALRTEYTFTLALQGANPLEHLDALFSADCDDATFGERDGVYYADFDREAPSLADAVGSAIRDVEKAVPGLMVIRVEPEDLVSASAIAERTGRSRESVRLLIDGKRGPGSFPAPALWASGKRPLWRWVDVVHWFQTYAGQSTTSCDEASFLAALNGALEVRRHAGHLASAKERREVARLISEDAELLTV